MLVIWILSNGTLAALGALLALGHPLTILGSFLAAPITSMNPTIGVGMVTGIMEYFFRKPRVEDMEKLQDDATTLKGWYRNRIIPGSSCLLLLFPGQFHRNVLRPSPDFSAPRWLKPGFFFFEVRRPSLSFGGSKYLPDALFNICCDNGFFPFPILSFGREFGEENPFETHLSGSVHPSFQMGNRTNFTGQAHLPQGYQIGGQGNPSTGGVNCQG